MSLRAVVLLAGSVRATDLSRSVGRSLLDLPLGLGETVLSSWRARVEAFAARVGCSELPVRVLLSRAGLPPQVHGCFQRAPVTVEQDRAELRGTAGILRDLAESYDDGDRLLVANAAQVLTEPLEELAAELLDPGADVGLVAYDDGTPSGLSAVRCGALRSIREKGFVDFKEQVLPALAAAGKSIRVARRARGSGIPVRTLDGYLEAVRACTRTAAGRPVDHDPFDEDWFPTFSLVERGADVAPGATIHDSVVLAGSHVGQGAVVVRSVVSGVVPPGAVVADRIVGHTARSRRARSV